MMKYIVMMISDTHNNHIDDLIIETSITVSNVMIVLTL